MVQLGNIPGEAWSLVLQAIVGKELDVRGSFRFNRVFGQALEARAGELVLQFEGVLEVARVEEARKTVQHVGGQVHSLADLAHAALAPEGNDVGDHADPIATVAPVHFLDDLFASLAAGQVQVDVRPGFPAAVESRTVLVQKPLE